MLIGGLVVLVLALGGYMLWQGGGFGGMATSTQTGAPSPVPPGTPTPSPTPLPAASAPTVETNTSAVVSNSTAVVTGRVTPNGAPTTYWYEYGATTALGERSNAQSIGSGFSAIPAPGYITGLSANTTYYARLSAENAVGRVNGTTYSFTTNTNPPPVGAAPVPTTQAASNVERTTAQLNGRVDANGVQTSYWFEWGDSRDFGRVTPLRSAGNGTAAVSVSASLSDLSPRTTYFFRINAQNQFGTVNGSTLSFRTKNPSATSTIDINL